MKFHRLLPVLPLLLASLLPAQQGTLNSHQVRNGLLDRLGKLSPAEFQQIGVRAQAGDAAAQYELAWVYEMGQFVPRDRNAFNSWMLKSAEQGYVPAECELGKSYLGPAAYKDLPAGAPVPNYADADRWLRMAAIAGDPEAQFWLGQSYLFGDLGSVDYHDALIWLLRAAAQRYSLAESSLGQMYNEGLGVPKDHLLAAGWYNKAADHAIDFFEVNEAVVHLGYLYRDTELSHDYLEAYKWALIIDSGLDPPTNEDVRRAAKHLTKAQTSEGQRMAQEWESHHRYPPKEVLQAE
jgi:uncharacterized protein